MYFELTNDILHEIGITRPEDLPMEVGFISGSIITEQLDDPMVFTTNAKSGESPPDFWGKGMPVMSKKFLDLLEEAGVDNLQKFPAIIQSNKDDSVWGNYFVVNILGLIKCVDFSKSKYKELFPGHFRFSELAIDVKIPKGALLFRLQENPGTILIDKSVGKHIMLSDPDELLTGWDVDDVIQ